MRSSFLSLLLRVGVPCVATAVLVAAPMHEAHADEVDELFDAGNADFKAGRLDAALDKLTRAWKGRQTFDIAANLSVVERKLGKMRDAAEHLSYALRIFPATGDPQRRSRMESDLAEIDRDVGKVVIQVPPNTIIQVDGVVIGTSPLPGTVYVEPGTRVIVGEHPTLGKARAEVACAQGKEVTVMLELHTSPGGGKTTPPRTHRSFVPAIVGFAVGAGGLAAGGALLAVHGGQLGDAQALGKTSHCSKADPAGSCPALDKAASKANTTGNAATGMFVVGGVGVAAGTGLLIWALTGGESAPATDKTAFIPWVGPSTAGGELHLRF